MNAKENLKLIPLLFLLSHTVNMGICRPQSFFGVSPFSWNRNDNSVNRPSFGEKIQTPISTVLKAIGSPFSRKSQTPVETYQNKQIVFPDEIDDSYQSIPQIQSRIDTEKPSKYVEDIGTPNNINFSNEASPNDLINEPDSDDIEENSITTTENDISTTEDYETTTEDDSGLDFRGGGVNSNVVASLLGR